MSVRNYLNKRKTNGDSRKRKYDKGGSASNKYWILKHPDSSAPPETVFETNEYDQQLIQKKFDELVSTLKVGEILEYGKTDATHYHPSILEVEMTESGPITYTRSGKKRKYIKKYELGGGVQDKPHGSTKLFAKGGKVGDVYLPKCNLLLYGWENDTNGNRVVKVGYPNDRAFSIQVNGVLKETQNIGKGNPELDSLTDDQLETISKEVVSYVSQFGSKKQRGKLRRHFEKGGDTSFGYAVVFIQKGKYSSVETDIPDQAELVYDALVDYMGKHITKSELNNTLESYGTDVFNMADHTGVKPGYKYYSGFYEKEIPVLYVVNLDKKTKEAWEGISSLTEKDDDDDTLIEYTIPSWALSALINNDSSALSGEDIAKLDKFVSGVKDKWGNANFMMPPNEENYDLGFRSRNDIDNLGDNCYMLVIRPDEDKFEEGGKVEKVHQHKNDLRSQIEAIIQRNLPGFSYDVHESVTRLTRRKAISIRISPFNKDYIGTSYQDVSLFLDVETMELHPQMFGGMGGGSIYREPDKNNPEEKYLQMVSVRIPFRKPKKTETAVLKAIDKFTIDYKKLLIENKDVLIDKNKASYDILLKENYEAGGHPHGSTILYSHGGYTYRYTGDGEVLDITNNRDQVIQSVEIDGKVYRRDGTKSRYYNDTDVLTRTIAQSGDKYQYGGWPYGSTKLYAAGGTTGKIYTVDSYEERGHWTIDVSDPRTQQTIWDYSFEGGEDETSIIEDGYMRHKDDIDGLEKYLKDLKVIEPDDSLVDSDEYEDEPTIEEQERHDQLEAEKDEAEERLLEIVKNLGGVGTVFMSGQPLAWRYKTSVDSSESLQVPDEFISEIDSLQEKINDYDEFVNRSDYFQDGGSVDNDQLEEVYKNYAIAALWSTSDMDNEDENLDANYSIEDIDPKTEKYMRDFVRKFLNDNRETIIESGLTNDQLGHSLWLSQNGHGAGFFDYGTEAADKLHQAVRRNEVDLYAGDDGKLHIMQAYAEGGQPHGSTKLFERGGDTQPHGSTKLYKEGGEAVSKVANEESRFYSENKLPFIGTNLQGKRINMGYVVLAFEFYPLWYWSDADTKWFMNENCPSDELLIMTSQSRPHWDVQPMSMQSLCEKMVLDATNKFKMGGALAKAGIGGMSIDNTYVAHAGGTNTTSSV